MTVGDGCSVYLGSSVATTRTGVVEDPGTFDLVNIVVAAGGKITATPDLTGETNEIYIQVERM
ncbi:hypothetical protein DPMN_117909 [Dreissena polymorpha]|uniref:Uncharacterized protein n=1 Tax=Dreissena polymorpha TaxID=45954 RepID=A0A9D4JPR5_DREPO|nr:hypothetical protein DPMN_117909 [Dreissena polymorpha]